MVRIDPEITRRKYERECAAVRANDAALRKQRCQIIAMTFPFIDALVSVSGGFVVRTATAPTTPNPLIFNPPYVDRVAIGSVAPVGIRLALDDYDIRAPALTFHQPGSWQLLPPNMIPGCVARVAGRAVRVLIDSHPNFPRPFLCLPGFREFHEHRQHADRDWPRQRTTSRIVDLLLSVTHVFRARCVADMRRSPPTIEWEPEA